jgi:hypothetical protein
VKLNLQPISGQTGEEIGAEFGLPALVQVRRRLSELMEDPEPVMQQLVRVFFIGEGTYCPGFQFLPGGQVHPTVASLFRHALELRIPHNYFTAWMITPARDLGGARPVDCLSRAQPLHQALEGFAAQLPGKGRAN